jgi:hypothetical protein
MLRVMPDGALIQRFGLPGGVLACYGCAARLNGLVLAHAAGCPEVAGDDDDQFPGPRSAAAGLREDPGHGCREAGDY